MKLHRELLDLAEELATSDNPAGPRRSVSTAYYALFHLLGDEAATMFFPSASDTLIRVATVRALDHRTMKQVCQWFSGSASFNRPVAAFHQNAPVPEKLKVLGRLFGRLQEARHDADYKPTEDVPWYEAYLLCVEVRKVFESVDELRPDPVYRLFLGSLLFANAWRI